MPVHDWIRVEAGIVHDFRPGWMPRFPRPGGHVPVPLEATYQTAWAAVPRRWRTVLEPTSDH